MKINKLILSKYKRFFLTNIDYLEYTPYNNIQVIIGPNGVGKSQLLKELSPLPADINKNYNSNGYKYIELEHNNYIYKLRSDNKHSFLQNDIELNPGGTKKVQLELVKQHFNITPQIFDILLNITKFTNMSPADRKYYLSECSTVDYTFPITVYNKLKTKHRDILGAIKMLQEDIVKSESLVLKQEDIDILKKNKSLLESVINHIVSLYDHNVKDFRENKTDKLDKLTRTVENTLIRKNTKRSIKQLTNDIAIYSNEIKNKTERLNIVKKDIDLIENMKSTDDVKTLVSKIETLDKELKALHKLDYVGCDATVDYSACRIYISRYKYELTNMLNSIVEYDYERTMSNEEKTKIKEDKNKLENTIRHIENKISLIDKEIETIQHIESHTEEVSCPVCNNAFLPGHEANKKRLEELDKERIELLKKKEETYKEYDKIDKIVNNIIIVEKTIESINIMSRNYDKILIFIRNLFTNKKIWSDSIVSILSYLEKIDNDFHIWIDIHDKTILKDKYLHQLEVARELEKKNIDINNTKIESLEKELIELTKDINSLNVKLTDSTIELNIANKLEDETIELVNLLGEYKRDFKYEIKKERNKYLTNLSNELRTLLMEIETKLSNMNFNNVKLERDKKTLREYIEKEKVLSKVLKELSPSEGLIAKSINSFINVFIKEMNSVINSIWTYEVELLPCEITDENDLNYKFKVKINNDEIIEDISKLSSSLQEIVNLAFRIVFGKYMKLDVPLFLDEFGSTFDKAHRTSAYHVIDKIITSDFNQIFIVCHYESLYGSFKNVDFNVLDTSNIELESISKYNERLKLK